MGSPLRVGGGRAARREEGGEGALWLGSAQGVAEGQERDGDELDVLYGEGVGITAIRFGTWAVVVSRIFRLRQIAMRGRLVLAPNCRRVWHWILLLFLAVIN